MLTLEEDFEPVRTFVLLEVAVEPLVKIIVDTVEVSEVYMTEGQEMNISCIAEEAYPRPVFKWFISKGFVLQEKQVTKILSSIFYHFGISFCTLLHERENVMFRKFPSKFLAYFLPVYLQKSYCQYYKPL